GRFLLRNDPLFAAGRSGRPRKVGGGSEERRRQRRGSGGGGREGSGVGFLLRDGWIAGFGEVFSSAEPIPRGYGDFPASLGGLPRRPLRAHRRRGMFVLLTNVTGPTTRRSPLPLGRKTARADDWTTRRVPGGLLRPARLRSIRDGFIGR